MKYKILFAFAIPYLTICAGLWHIGYWSTFDINILEHLDLDDIIKSFIYPFVSSVILYFIAQIIYSLFLKKYIFGQNDFKYGGAEEVIPNKRLIIIRLIISGLSLSFIVFELIFVGNRKWIDILFLVAIFTGVFFNNRNFLENIIPDRNFRLNFVFTIILIPCLSFGFAKKKSLDIYDNINNQATITSITTNQNQDKPILNNKYKLLGMASDYVFLMTLDNKSIVLIPNGEIKEMTIENTNPHLK